MESSSEPVVTSKQIDKKLWITERNWGCWLINKSVFINKLVNQISCLPQSPSWVSRYVRTSWKLPPQRQSRSQLACCRRCWQRIPAWTKSSTLSPDKNWNYVRFKSKIKIFTSITTTAWKSNYTVHRSWYRSYSRGCDFLGFQCRWNHQMREACAVCWQHPRTPAVHFRIYPASLCRIL